MRLDKFLADTTELSRTLAAKAIKHQRVTVNGQLAKSASVHLTPADRVQLDGQPLAFSQGFRYLLLNKPAGFVCANSDAVHPLVFDLLPQEMNKTTLHTVGRLDKDTTGLLLITDDGQFSHHLTSPRRHQIKIYRAWLAEDLGADAEQQLLAGLLLDDSSKLTLPATLERIGPREVRLGIKEGRYHQVKRMFAALGNAVVRLHREQLGNLVLDEKMLPTGTYRALTIAEVEALLGIES